MVARGETIVLTSTFRSWEDGPLVAVTDVQVQIMLGSTVIAGPFTDVTMLGTGLAEYQWTVPANAVPGVYYARWSAVYPGASQPSVGIEAFTVETFAGVYAGCPWPMDPACQTAEWLAHSQEVRDRALALASSVLSRLTGGRVGNCPITVVPARQKGCCWIPVDGYSLGGFRPYIDGTGAWRNCGTTGDDPNVIRLPSPATRLTSVVIGGVAQPLADWHLAANGTLRWTGTGPNPAPPEPQTSADFNVTYLNAYPVDSNAAYAVGVLALEFAKACAGTKCRLPSGVTNIVRQGVSYEVQSGAFPNGFTGIREVDTFIGLWNPGALKRGATVWSPDLPTTRRA